MSILHLASCSSGAEMLRLKFRDCDVAYLPVDLAYAPLFRDFSETSLEQYIDRCDNLLNISAHFPNLLDELEAFCRRDFSQYDEVVVWHGDTAGEQLFFSFVCALVGRQLSEVDLRGVYSAGWRAGSVAISACSPDNLEMLWGNVRRLPDSEKQQAAERWNDWSQMDADLRIKNDIGEIVGVDKRFYDKTIISACGNEWQPAMRVVGRILFDVGFGVGDGFLHRRVVELAREGEILVRRNENAQQKPGVNLSLPSIIVGGIDLSSPRLFEVKRICDCKN